MNTVLLRSACIVCMLLFSISLPGCPPPAVGPVANFEADVITGNAPLTVQFTDISTPGGSAITQWLWAFGDGGTSNEPNPAHTYMASGFYDVSLTVTTNIGANTVVASSFIAVTTPDGPMADFTADVTSGDAPLAVQFTDVSTPGDEPITQWTWDFGDGGASNEANPSHTYTVAGTYDVSLTVTTNIGQNTKVASVLIQVTAGHVAGDTETILLPGDLPMVMVWMPAGNFQMGSPEEEQDREDFEGPQHLVTFASGFWMGKYEVTKAQWQAVMGTTPWLGQPSVLESPDSPAVYLTWDDTQAFITALNAVTSQTFRLPSEAEWEYACRAETTTRFYWGDDLDEALIGTYAWYYYSCPTEQYAHDVGQKQPNTWGLYDMLGNALEWCEDDYIGDYLNTPVDGSAFMTTSPRTSARVMRGGAFVYIHTWCRSAYRYAINMDFPSYDTGFRLAR